MRPINDWGIFGTSANRQLRIRRVSQPQSVNRSCVHGALPQKSACNAVLRESEMNLTPKEFANFSPGFPTPGQFASAELLTLKEFHPVP